MHAIPRCARLSGSYARTHRARYHPRLHPSPLSTRVVSHFLAFQQCSPLFYRCVLQCRCIFFFPACSVLFGHTTTRNTFCACRIASSRACTRANFCPPPLPGAQILKKKEKKKSRFIMLNVSNSSFPSTLRQPPNQQTRASLCGSSPVKKADMADQRRRSRDTRTSFLTLSSRPTASSPSPAHGTAPSVSGT